MLKFYLVAKWIFVKWKVIEMNYKKLFLLSLMFTASIGLFAAEGGGEPGGAPVEVAVEDQMIQAVIYDRGEGDKKIVKQSFNVPLFVLNKFGFYKAKLDFEVIFHEGAEKELDITGIDGITFELLVAWLTRVGDVENTSEEQDRVYTALKDALVDQCEAENIKRGLNQNELEKVQLQVDLLVSLSNVVDYLQVHIVADKEETETFTLDIIAQVLVDLLIRHKESIFDGKLALPEVSYLNSDFLSCFKNRLIRDELPFVFIGEIPAREGLFGRSVAAFPDGKILLGSFDGTIRVWRKVGDAWACPEGNISLGNTGAISSVAVFQNGDKFVTGGSDDGKIRIWEYKNGRWICPEGAILSGDAHSIYFVGVLPSDDTIISGGADGRVRLWKKVDGRWSCPEENILSGDGSAVGRMALFPNGDGFVTGYRSGILRVWEKVDGRWVCPDSNILAGHEGAVYCVAVFPNGGKFVSGGLDGTVRVWEKVNGRWVCPEVNILRGHVFDVRSVVVLPNGYFASESTDGKICVWEEVDGRWVKVVRSLENILEGYRGSFKNLSVLSNGRVLVSSSDSRDGGVSVWSSKLLVDFKDYLNCWQVLVALFALKYKQLPKLGTSARKVFDSIDLAIRDEIMRLSGILEQEDDAIPAAEPAEEGPDDEE